MSPRAEKIRKIVNDGLTEADIDVRHLAVEAVDGHLILRGTLPSIEQKERLLKVLRTHAATVDSIDCDVDLQPVPRDDSADGRGRPLGPD